MMTAPVWAALNSGGVTDDAAVVVSGDGLLQMVEPSSWSPDSFPAV